MLSGSEPDFIPNDNYGILIPINEDYGRDILQDVRNSYDNK